MTQKIPLTGSPAEPHNDAPSAWVRRFSGCVPQGGEVLDLACGAGRHSRLFLQLDHSVVAVDRDLSRLQEMPAGSRFTALQHDLEDGGSFALKDRQFAAVIVTNYLFRPILAAIVQAVAPGGVLIYETFAQGNERFGHPSNPDFLLAPGELLDAVAGQLRVLAYEDLLVDSPEPAAVQRICARREL